MALNLLVDHNLLTPYQANRVRAGTTFGMILGQVHPTSGTAYIRDISVQRQLCASEFVGDHRQFVQFHSQSPE